MHDAARDVQLLDNLALICVEAGRAILDVYEGPAIAARTKDDLSPVTDADERAEAILISGLARLLPYVQVIAEESCSRDGAPVHADETFLLVDPLDGTREFLAKNGEFTVNVALVHQRRPVLGCVFAPALGAIWLGSEALGARVARMDIRQDPPADGWRPISVRRAPDAGLCAVASRSHSDAATEEFLAKLTVSDRRAAGSSLKFCLVAEGEADVYPRTGPTMEWDTAAGHAVLSAAGGSVTGLDGSEFLYGKSQSGFRNGGFVAWGARG